LRRCPRHTSSNTSTGPAQTRGELPEVLEHGRRDAQAYDALVSVVVASRRASLCRRWPASTLRFMGGLLCRIELSCLSFAGDALRPGVTMPFSAGCERSFEQLRAREADAPDLLAAL
jgi:hypothetical protein